MGSRPTEHVETELKFEVGLDYVLPDLGGLAKGSAVSEPEAYTLVASYFDTADLRMA
jgi:inorganic triphosphatase YgiF